MTLPGEPKIRINPSDDERATLPEWFEVDELDGDVVNIRHIKPSQLCGYFRLHRRDACTLADHIAAYLWKPGDEKDTANQVDVVEDADVVGDAAWRALVIEIVEVLEGCDLSSDGLASGELVEYRENLFNRVRRMLGKSVGDLQPRPSP